MHRGRFMGAAPHADSAVRESTSEATHPQVAWAVMLLKMPLRSC